MNVLCFKPVNASRKPMKRCIDGVFKPASTARPSRSDSLATATETEEPPRKKLRLLLGGKSPSELSRAKSLERNRQTQERIAATKKVELPAEPAPETCDAAASDHGDSLYEPWWRSGKSNRAMNTPAEVSGAKAHNATQAKEYHRIGIKGHPKNAGASAKRTTGQSLMLRQPPLEKTRPSKWASSGRSLAIQKSGDKYILTATFRSQDKKVPFEELSGFTVSRFLDNTREVGQAIMYTSQGTSLIMSRG